MRVEEPGGPDAISDDPDRPVYQVNLFTRLAEPAEVPEEQRGFHVSEWKLHDADVSQVLAWASEQAADRSYVVYVAAADHDDPHLLHLFGHDPNRGEGAGEPFVLAPDVVPNMEDMIRQMRESQ
jgi:hypothetical protein